MSVGPNAQLGVSGGTLVRGKPKQIASGLDAVVSDQGEIKLIQEQVHNICTND